MRGARIFIDSTTFLYSNDRLDAERRLKARLWLEELTIADTGRSNLQVLNEVTNVLIKKAPRFDYGDPFAKVDAFADFGSTSIGIGTMAVGRDIYRRYRYSWWDCILLASALELGCTHFLSEDLQDGQVIEDSSHKSLTIIDPFAHTPGQILVSP